MINDLYQEMTDREFFVKNPIKAKTPYLVTAIAFIFLGMSFVPFLLLRRIWMERLRQVFAINASPTRPICPKSAVRKNKNI